MAFPSHADFVVIGAGIHGLSTAWRLADRLTKNGEEVEGRIVVIDKSGIAAGASGIACGVVRNNYYQPAMRNLMKHSVDIWEENAEALSYNPVGYMQISCEAMHEDVAKIYQEQQDIGYDSTFVEGESDCTAYMKQFFGDWRAQNITSVLHEKRGGFAHNTTSIYGLAKFAESLGVRILTGVEVTGFQKENGSASVSAVETDRGVIECNRVVIAAGPWVRDFWSMLDLPSKIDIRASAADVHKDVDMWRFWQLEEGVLNVSPETLLCDDGSTPPVLHVDTDAPLLSDVDGSVISEELWGIYYKPDTHFGGIQGGASPYKVDTPTDKVAIDPYGPASDDFIASPEFAHMWVSALAHCHERFSGTMPKFRREPAGGVGCFTPDSFPIFDHFFDNVSIIADSNHGYKMIGVGHLIADEVLGEQQDLLEPFRLSRFETGDLHPVSSSPFPWS
ncbi:MAG: FAD-binding oxidoreductase [Pseudomonadota bacterium]